MYFIKGRASQKKRKTIIQAFTKQSRHETILPNGDNNQQNCGGATLLIMYYNPTQAMLFFSISSTHHHPGGVYLNFGGVDKHLFWSG